MPTSMLARLAARLLDSPHDVAARHVRKRERHARHAPADEDVEVVERARENPHQHLVRAWFAPGQVA